jgi:hypothetical protein
MLLKANEFEIPVERSIWRDRITNEEYKIDGVGLWQPDHSVIVICYRSMRGGHLLVDFLTTWHIKFEQVTGTRELQPHEKGM